jgi:hypothetical protein
MAASRLDSLHQEHFGESLIDSESEQRLAEERLRAELADRLPAALLALGLQELGDHFVLSYEEGRNGYTSEAKATLEVAAGKSLVLRMLDDPEWQGLLTVIVDDVGFARLDAAGQVKILGSYSDTLLDEKGLRRLPLSLAMRLGEVAESSEVVLYPDVARVIESASGQILLAEEIEWLTAREELRQQSEATVTAATPQLAEALDVAAADFILEEYETGGSRSERRSQMRLLLDDGVSLAVREQGGQFLCLVESAQSSEPVLLLTEGRRERGVGGWLRRESKSELRPWTVETLSSPEPQQTRYLTDRPLEPEAAVDLYVERAKAAFQAALEPAGPTPRPELSSLAQPGLEPTAPRPASAGLELS